MTAICDVAVDLRQKDSSPAARGAAPEEEHGTSEDGKTCFSLPLCLCQRWQEPKDAQSDAKASPGSLLLLLESVPCSDPSKDPPRPRRSQPDG